MTQDKLKKIYALALEGIGGEKEQAKNILDKLLKKYDFSIEDIEKEELKIHPFIFHGKEEKQLLHQVSYKVTNKCDNVYGVINNKSGRKIKTELRIECTEAQKVEIDFLFEFYKTLWNDEKAFFFDTFIQKHRLFGETPTGEKGKELTFEEEMKMLNLMRGMEEGEILRQIPETL